MEKHTTVHITIDKHKFDSPSKTTGEALYRLGGVGVEYDLYQESPGQGDDPLIPNSNVSQTVKNGDHFYTAQRSLNPGSIATESEILMPEGDREFLESKDYAYTVSRVGAEVHLIISDFPLSSAYSPVVADLLVVIPAGYPQSNPDMFWTYPAVQLVTGGHPTGANVMTQYGDRVWQRWSRHFPGGWRAGIDGIKTYLASIRRELAKGI